MDSYKYTEANAPCAELETIFKSWPCTIVSFDTRIYKVAAGARKLQTRVISPNAGSVSLHIQQKCRD